MAFVQLGAGTLLNPTPVVMVSLAAPHTRPNIITIAWTGTVCTQPPMLSISIRPQRHSHDIIMESGEFVVNLVGRALLEACDYCGVKSGRDLDKFEALGLSAVPAQDMAHAPAIAQSPMYLSCKVTQTLSLGSHTMFLARVLAVGVQDSLVDKDSGRLLLDKAELVAYSHGEYIPLAAPEGFFGYSVARPEVLKRRMPPK